MSKTEVEFWATGTLGPRLQRIAEELLSSPTTTIESLKAVQAKVISEVALHAAMDAFYPGEDWRRDLGQALPSSLRDMEAALKAAALATPTGAGTETREAGDLRAALEDTKAAADDLAQVCLDVGDNKAAGALQFISGFISDRLAALAPATPAPAVDGVESLFQVSIDRYPKITAALAESEWSDLSPAEVVRRTRCQADDYGVQNAAVWRVCCDEILQRLAPTPSPESTLSLAQVATRDGGGAWGRERGWQGCDPDEPYDPLKCAIWAALVPFQNELLATGGVTFMGLRNSIVEAVRSFAIASQRGATTPASAGEGDLRALASRLVDEINDLINESGGVWGLHLNGDDATWADITVGGRFERLPSLHDLREVLAAPAASTEEGLRKALDRIANPILHMQREVPEGHQLDGQMARSLVTVEYLQSIARDALAPPGKSVQAIAAPAGDGAGEKRYPYSEPKAWPYWACPDCNCKNFGPVDEQKPDMSFGPGPLIRCVNCKAVFDTRPQAPTEANSQDRTSTYLTERRDHWLNEAQRLALLVRSLGGDPDAHGEI